jgi:hypothetical protein
MFPVSKARWEVHLSTWLSICIESCKLFWRECTEANHFYSFSVTLPWICCRTNASTWHTYLLRFFSPVIIRTKAAPAGSSTHTTIVRITAGPVYTKQYVQHWNIFPTYNWTDTGKIRALSLPQADFSTDQHRRNTIFQSLHYLSRVCRVLTASAPPSELRPRQTRGHDYILHVKNSRYENDLA